MVRLPSRQVHLDFHTSELIPGVGSQFEKANFQQALKLGNLNSITIFAKCHHGVCYYPTKVGKPHPTLGIDLTGAMMDAAHEIGVRAPIYITVGWSARDAEEHPEWLARNPDGSIQNVNYDVDASIDAPKPLFSWKTLCPSGSYAQHIYALTKEICDRYTVVDGLFYDIVFVNDACWCDTCRAGMKELGMNPEDPEDAKRYFILNRQRFLTQCAAILKEKHPHATLFFNSGGADMYRPEYHPYSTHYEMEDLPTTWGGYDKMPPRAKFFARSGRDYLGMTGKFHTSWGEFGGFKNPEALRFECAAMLAYGARCSIGDQMHPVGTMDMETYRLIGQAYRYVEEIEPYCYDTEETARLGIVLSGSQSSDEGLVKMLLERQIDFDIVLSGENLSRFDVIILPDCVTLDNAAAARFNAYVANGGRLLLTGDSGLNIEGSAFAIDVGAKYIGKSPFDIDYAQTEELAKGLVTSPFLFYGSGNRVSLEGGRALAAVRDPYFSRTYGHYCSHQYTPYTQDAPQYPAAVEKGGVIYLAHAVCSQYYEHGAQIHRDYFINALCRIYDKPAMWVELPSGGRARLVRQRGSSRYVLHLLYANPIQRGSVSVIEDLPELRDIPVELRIAQEIKAAKLVPGGEDVAFTQCGGIACLTVPKLKCHQMVVLDY